MLRHGKTARQASNYANSDNGATQHRIQLAKAVILITEMAGSQNTITVINTALDLMEPVFTREVA